MFPHLLLQITDRMACSASSANASDQARQILCSRCKAKPQLRLWPKSRKCDKSLLHNQTGMLKLAILKKPDKSGIKGAYWAAMCSTRHHQGAYPKPCKEPKALQKAELYEWFHRSKVKK